MEQPRYRCCRCLHASDRAPCYSYGELLMRIGGVLCGDSRAPSGARPHRGRPVGMDGYAAGCGQYEQKYEVLYCSTGGPRPFGDSLHHVLALLDFWLLHHKHTSKPSPSLFLVHNLALLHPALSPSRHGAWTWATWVSNSNSSTLPPRLTPIHWESTTSGSRSYIKPHHQPSSLLPPSLPSNPRETILVVHQ
jgi:hypothetical protein